MLSLLLGLQVESSETTEVLLADSLVNRRSTTDSLAVVVGRVRPPISFRLHKSENHVLNWYRQAGDLSEDRTVSCTISCTTHFIINIDAHRKLKSTVNPLHFVYTHCTCYFVVGKL